MQSFLVHLQKKVENVEQKKRQICQLHSQSLWENLKVIENLKSTLLKQRSKLLMPNVVSQLPPAFPV